MSIRRRPPADGAPAAPPPLPHQVRPWRALIALMRPGHWLKNSFVLVGLIYGHFWNQPALLGAIALVFAAFCLAASSVYCFNDWADAEADRRHTRKSRRPVAGGMLAPRAALWLAAGLAIAALAVAWAVGWRPASVIGFYLALNLAYSLRLKHFAVLDVLCIAAGFGARLLAGTWAVGIPPSSWLLICGLLFTLFLALGKRRAELADALDGASAPGAARAALAGYSLRALDWALTLSGALTLLAYGAYTLSPETRFAHGSAWLAATVPLVALALGRYTLLIHIRRGGDDPAAAIWADAPLALLCGAFAAATLLILR